jgi:hypothetical protein
MWLNQPSAGFEMGNIEREILMFAELFATVGPYIYE